jgi:MOSC domain-containing protein YiiM
MTMPATASLWHGSCPFNQRSLRKPRGFEMNMSVMLLSIGLPKKEIFHGKEWMTGICKKPADGSRLLTRHGFEGDGVGDLKHHGGDDKAVCVYSIEHYPYWEEVFGITMPQSAFGENLSVLGMREEDVCIGDVYRIGTAEVQVSQPRQPCRTLAARYGRDDLVKLVVDSGRTGWYFKVVSEGRIQTGDWVTLLKREARGVSVAFANQIYHHNRKDSEGIEKVLSVPALSASWRMSFLELREKA